MTDAIRISFLALTLGVVLFAPKALIAQETKLDQQQVAKLVDQLGADTFAERQKAMRQLMEAGPSVVQDLLPASRSEDAEQRMRAMSVLARLASEDEVGLDNEAAVALQMLGRSENVDVKNTANRHLKRLAEKLQDKAIARLKELGATLVTRRVNVTQRDSTYETTATILEDTWKGTEADFAILAWIVNLKEVLVAGEIATDGAVRQLQNSQSLEKLELKRPAITNQGVAEFSKFPSLRSLMVAYSDIDDECQVGLETLTQLSQLRLHGTNVSRSTAKLVGEKLKLQVDWHTGAFLGIMFNVNSEERCTLTNVVRDSAAQRGGLKTGDQLIEMDGQNLESAINFQKLMATKYPGDKFKLVVDRRGVKIDLEVELGRYPDIDPQLRN